MPNQSQRKWLSTSPGIGPLIEEFVNRLAIELHSVKRATVPTELNVFTDASSVAWVFEIRDANHELVCAKGGLVCPSHTIPRNELVATHAATSFLKGFVETVPVKQITIFTDSLCTVQRLNANCTEKVPAFEQRRLSEIREILTDFNAKQLPTGLLHIPGDINPADFATRPHVDRPRPSIDKELLSQYKRLPWVPRVTRVMLLRPNRSEPNCANLAQNEHEDMSYSMDIATIIERSQKKFPITMNEHNTYDQHGYVRRDDRLVIPEQDAELQTWLFARHHDQTHRGVTATFAALSKQYFWPGMRREVKRFVNNCNTCPLARHTRTIRTTAGDVLTLQDIESIPLGSIVGVDIAVIDGCGEEDATCIITTTCLISRFVRSLPMHTQLSEEIVETLKTLLI